MKSILVTGSSGQLGREIVRQLRQKGYTVLGIDLTPSPTTDEQIDIRQPDAVREVSRQMDAVIHTAALHGPHTAAGYSRQAFIDTNITATLNLLEACQAHGIDNFVFTSSTSVYGQALLNPIQAVWVDETLRPIPRDIYDITKLAAENLCADVSGKDGLSVSVIRPGRFFEESPNKLANNRLYRGVDVRDGASAHVLALAKKPVGFNVYNVAAYSPFQPHDLLALKTNAARVIRSYYPQIDAIYAARDWSLPVSIDRVYVTQKAQQQLGYSSVHNFWEFINEDERTLDTKYYSESSRTLQLSVTGS